MSLDDEVFFTVDLVEEIDVAFEQVQHDVLVVFAGNIGPPGPATPLPDRLAEHSTLVPSNDCNQVRDNGWYYATDQSLNTPAPGVGAWFAIQMLDVAGGGYPTQIAYEHNGSRVWKRWQLAGSAWQAWQQLAPVNDAALPPRIKAGAFSGASIANANDAVQSGWYNSAPGNPNNPTPADHYLIEAVAGSSDFVRQFAYYLYGPAIWTRNGGVSSGWNVWVKVCPPTTATSMFSTAGNDCNLMREPLTIYSGVGGSEAPLNSPTSPNPFNGTIQFMGDASVGYQVATDYGNFAQWHRGYWYGGWYPWKQIQPISDTNLPARLKSNTGLNQYADFNAINETGWGFGVNATNAPVGGWLHVFTLAFNPNTEARQFAYSLGGTNASWMRNRSDTGVWSAWVQTLPADDAALPYRLYGAPAPPNGAMGNDLNNAKANGWYLCWPTTLNRPDNGDWYWSIQVIALDVGSVAQIAYEHGLGTIKMRNLYSNVWSSWIQIYPATDPALPLRLRTLTSGATGSDFNLTVETGWYVTYPNTANMPPGQNDYGHLRVSNIGGGNILQDWQHYNSDEKWSRQSSGGFNQWRPWVKVYPGAGGELFYVAQPANQPLSPSGAWLALGIAINYDGSPIMIEYSCAWIGNVTGAFQARLDLYDSGTPVGILTRLNLQATGEFVPVTVRQRVVPTPGSHCYQIYGVNESGNNAMVSVPAFMRITKA